MEGFQQAAIADVSAVQGASEPAERRRIDPRTGKTMLLHDASFWRAHDAERRRRGQSIVEYSAAHNLALSTYRRWASRLRAQANAPGGVGSAQKIDGAAFLAVPIRRAATAAHSDAPVEVFFEAGVSVKLAGEAAARVLETVMARLSSAR